MGHGKRDPPSSARLGGLGCGVGKITYVWEENGQEKRDVHVARRPEETYTIRCASKPLMKSIILELAE